MPTYNFKSNGEIEIDGVVKQTIEGPAVLSPRTLADTFYLKYLDGNDLYYYSPNTYQIDGEEFDGSLAQFCVAASALYESAGGGGGESYPDITDDVTIALASTTSFNIVDDEGMGLLSAVVGTTDKVISLGDPDGLITEGPSSAIQVMRDSGSGFGTVALTSVFNNYNSFASVQVRAVNDTDAFSEVKVATSGFTGGLKVDKIGISLLGILEYADNAAAVTAGLTPGYLYRTGDDLKIVH